MSLPASITGTHAKKQGEDLSDNDGDEDEGISMVNKDGAWVVFFFLFSFFLNMSMFSKHLWVFLNLFFFSNYKCNHQAPLWHYNV